MTRVRKITATISTVALLGAGGLGIAQSATAAKQSGSTSARQAGKRGGGPLATAQLAAIAKTLGVTSAQLKAALDASRPTGTRPKDGMATALATALNVDVAKVTAILDANRPAKPAAGTKPAKGARPARPDDAKLVTALATGLGVDEATVKTAFDTIEAAHQADHAARETAMYAAVAKELGLSADAVEAAFEANRPAKPAK
jgi:protein-disulfide isomerase-like protein with CxxC motif